MSKRIPLGRTVDNPSTLEAWCTVGDLIDRLKTFDPAAPVMATWEGVYRPIGKIQVAEDTCNEYPAFRDREGRIIVEIDVDPQEEP